MIAIVTAPYLRNRCYHVEETPMISRCATASSVALNCSSRPSKKRKVQLNFCLLTVACIQLSGCGLNVLAMPKIIGQKPQKSMIEHTKHSWRQFCARMPLQTRKGRCLVAEYSLGTYIIYIYHIVFDLCLMEKEERKKERKKMNKIKIFSFGFLVLDKGQGN